MLWRTQKLVWCLGYGYHFLTENLSAGGWETTGGSAPKFSLEEDASKSGSSSTFSSVSEIFFCRFHCQVAVTKPHWQKPFLRCYFEIEKWHEQKEHRSGKSLESCCTCLPMSGELSVVLTLQLWSGRLGPQSRRLRLEEYMLKRPWYHPKLSIWISVEEHWCVHYGSRSMNKHNHEKKI